jgi:hypothetical protein
MPYVSRAQAGYFHTHKAALEKQGVNVDEWDAATKGQHLPKRASVKASEPRASNSPRLRGRKSGS